MSRSIAVGQIGRFHAHKEGCIHIKCRRCGKTRSNIKRSSFDHPDAVVILMSYCDRCDTGGEWEETEYFDKDGKALSIHDEA